MVSVSGTSAGRWITVAMGVAMVGAMVGATGFPGDGLRAGDVIYVCDSTEDGVYRLEDKDGDGSIAGPDEVLTFYDDTSAGPDLSVPSHLLLWDDGLLVLDGGTLDTILLLVDGNDDGDALDEGEFTVFYDNDGPGPNLSTPNTLAAGPDGCIYVADDGASVKAILRLVDDNDDGDALDEDEASIFYDTSALSPAEPLSDQSPWQSAPTVASTWGTPRRAPSTGSRISTTTGTPSMRMRPRSSTTVPPR